MTQDAENNKFETATVSIVNTKDEVYLLSEDEQLPCGMSAPTQNEKLLQFYYFWSYCFSVSG